MTHRMLAIAAALLATAAAALSGLRPTTDLQTIAAEIESGRDHISALDLADRIVQSDSSLRVFDLRSKPEFDDFHIPSAQPVALDQLLKQTFPADADIVLYSEGGTHAAQAWVLLRLHGYHRVHLLREGLYEWRVRVYEPRLASDASRSERAEFDRASKLSRFFGGTPLTGIPRAQLLQGYWTTKTDTAAPPARRHGC